MSETTKIEWCDHTFNPWIGCTKVSPGCANCYAEGESKRRGWARWGRGQPRHRTSDAYWREPLKWNRKAENLVERSRVFCASLADVFDEEVPDDWRIELFSLIADTPNLDWLILTKRPYIAHDFFHNVVGLIDGDVLPNVWLGVSVEDQARADERVPILLEIPARVRFLSCEPLLGPVQLCRGCPGCPDDCGWTPGSNGHGIHWVIAGGESGPRARPCDVEWIRSIANQCAEADVPVFVKQLGARPFFGPNPLVAAMHDRKGGDPDEWPADLRVRQFPQALCHTTTQHR